MGTQDAGSAGGEQKRHQRFSEPAKFLPVIFVCSNIIGLYLIYSIFHLYPMLQTDLSSDLRNSKMRQRAIIEGMVFNFLTLMLAICYVKSILIHPGEIPDKDQDASWEWVPDGRSSAAGAGPAADASVNQQELKRSGERRYCKWCAKYKPDRCHHCRVCRTCILKMDHHCPWIYNCVGFRNHKYFFLLLFYSVLACHLIMWTMIESVRTSVDVETPFLTMFLLLFGETLASFLGILLTAFFCFHIGLMVKAMTTIEFCEKSLKKTGYDNSFYDHGLLGNIRDVLGPTMFLWLLPCSTPTGDGLNFIGEHSRLTKSMESVRGGGGMRRKGHQKAPRARTGRSQRSGGLFSGEDSGGGSGLDPEAQGSAANRSS